MIEYKWITKHITAIAKADIVKTISFHLFRDRIAPESVSKKEA